MTGSISNQQPSTIRGEAQHVGGGLHDLRADNEMDQVATGDDAVETDEQEPGGDGERIEAHACSFSLTISVCSRNSTRISTKPAATSRPTDRLMSGTVPAEFRRPTSPKGSTFSMYATPATSPASPITAKPPPPTASQTSTSESGAARRRNKYSPAR